jgi:hypothetical protein
MENTGIVPLTTPLYTTVYPSGHPVTHTLRVDGLRPIQYKNKNGSTPYKEMSHFAASLSSDFLNQ